MDYVLSDTDTWLQSMSVDEPDLFVWRVQHIPMWPRKNRRADLTHGCPPA
jgi:hypothetical protein